MFSPSWLAWASLVATLCRASPLVPAHVPIVNVARGDELALRAALEVAARSPGLEKRLESSFDLAHSWKDQTLFDGSYHDDIKGVTDTVSLDVVCNYCYTTGTVKASLTDAAIVDPILRLDFSGVSAYVDISLAVNSTAVYTIPLFTSQSPGGLSFPGLSVGLVFGVDLVFTLSEELALDSAGFYVELASGSFIEASLFEGVVTRSFFDGLSSKDLPVVVHHDSHGTFQADLRLRVECGIDVGDVLDLGLGATAELGVYVNLVELVAELEPTTDCDLAALAWLDLNAGAFAELDVVINYSSFGAVPTVSTTLLTGPTVSYCVASVSSSATAEASVGLLSSAGLVGNAASASITAVSLSASASISDVFPSASASITTVFPSASSAFSGGAFSGGALSTGSKGNYSAIIGTAGASGAASATGAFSVPGSVHVSAIASASAAESTISTTASAAESTISTTASAAESTVFSTTTYTITRCAASVVNCPAAYQSEIIVTKTVSVCPASASASVSVSISAPPSVTAVIITDVIVLQPCATPIVNSFTPPSSLATATVAAAAVPPVKGVLGAIGNGTFWNATSIPAATASRSASGLVLSSGADIRLASASAAIPSASSSVSVPSFSYTQPTPSSMPTAVTAGAAPGRVIQSGSFVALAGSLVALVLL